MTAAVVSLQPSDLPKRPSRPVCQTCTAMLHVEHRPRLQIRPQHGITLASGTIIIENPVVLCATCFGRGIETRL